jgi:hypothetical protein
MSGDLYMTNACFSECQAKRISVRASSPASLRLSYAHIPLATCSLFPTLHGKVAVILLRRLSMMSSEAHKQSTEQDPETLYIDLVTISDVQERISKLALLLGTPPYLQSIKKLQEGVFAFQLTPELLRLRDDIINTVSRKIYCSNASNNCTSGLSRYDRKDECIFSIPRPTAKRSNTLLHSSAAYVQSHTSHKGR